MATVVILALALGVNVGLRDGATAARAGAVAPAGTYDGRLDPIEQNYIRGHDSGWLSHSGSQVLDTSHDHGWSSSQGSQGLVVGAAAPRPVFKPYDTSIDVMEQVNIDAANAAAALGAAPLGDSSRSQGELPRHRLAPR